jgi:hypothetical protein
MPKKYYKNKYFNEEKEEETDSNSDSDSDSDSNSDGDEKNIYKNKNKREEEELELIKKSVESIEYKKGKELVNSEEIKKIIKIVETFIRDKKLICYGGTAINNILPTTLQFYNRDIELPDYDFFSPNSLDDAKELTDIFYKAGYEDVEARSSIHFGTYKVFVNFIPVADVTKIDPRLFNAFKEESIKINGILYAPINFLRLEMYKELSRPKSEIERWEKVYKRLNLLNKSFPMRNKRCNKEEFRNDFESNSKIDNKLYNIVKNSVISQGLIFFGGYAARIYGNHYNKKNKLGPNSFLPDFDVLAEEPETASIILKERLEEEGYKKVVIKKKQGILKAFSPHFEIIVDGEVVCYIHEPIGCDGYNEIIINNNKVKIATIDTMISLFLGFLYSDKEFYDHDRILCMTNYLFEIQQQNKLEKKGLLKRFDVKCYGKENTLEERRSERDKKFKELKGDRTGREYEENFLKYSPYLDKETKNIETKKKEPKNKTKNKTKKKETKNKTKKRKTKNKSKKSILFSF